MPGDHATIWAKGELMLQTQLTAGLKQAGSGSQEVRRCRILRWQSGGLRQPGLPPVEEQYSFKLGYRYTGFDISAIFDQLSMLGVK